jgi:hypothetical protein
MGGGVFVWLGIWVKSLGSDLDSVAVMIQRCVHGA